MDNQQERTYYTAQETTQYFVITYMGNIGPQSLLLHNFNPSVVLPYLSTIMDSLFATHFPISSYITDSESVT